MLAVPDGKATSSSGANVTAAAAVNNSTWLPGELRSLGEKQGAGGAVKANGQVHIGTTLLAC